jgi:hypothetical protein
MNEGKTRGPKTDSEKIFKQYLESHELRNFEYEPHLPESERPPDFCLRYAGRRIILEVKEIRPPHAVPTVVDPRKPLWTVHEACKAHVTRGGLRIQGCSSDPYVSIRRKIEDAWEKLKNFPNDVCCVVLCDVSSAGPTALEPWLLYGAMFGKLEHLTLYDPKRGLSPEESFSVFSPQGGESRWDSGEPHKTNISAVIVLERFPVGQYSFATTAPRSESKLSAADKYVRTFKAMKLSRGTKRDASNWEIRVIVHENPFATKKLPEKIFSGPYDERYGLRHNRIQRISAGREIRKLEAQRPAAFKSPLAGVLQETARRRKALSGSH